MLASPNRGRRRGVLVDQDLENQVVVHDNGPGIHAEFVERNPQEAGFAPQPKRWRGEQTYGVSMSRRRLVRDRRRRPFSSASRVYRAMTHVMVRRLTGVLAHLVPVRKR
ncbi:hypothetical protein [Streptomyces sp. NPDC059176]|uniref:hypothetical protein n=1 Tax=unclassified Streptomyces TaxID=2593676 RepID=UPI00368496FA